MIGVGGAGMPVPGDTGRGQPPPFRPDSPPEGLHWDRSTEWPTPPAGDVGGSGERRELVFAIRLQAEQLVGLDLDGTRDRVLDRVREVDPGALCWCAADDRGGWLIIAVLAAANMWSVALAAVQDAFPGHEVLSRQ